MTNRKAPGNGGSMSERRRARAQRASSIAMFAAAAMGAVVLLPVAAMAQPVIASDQPAGYVVYPKIVSDPNDIFQTGIATETAIQLTNTKTTVPNLVVHCFYVDATSHCSNGTNSFDPPPNGKGACRTTADCDLGGVCQPNWDETDFTFVMSPGQPIGWNVSEGLSSIPFTGVGNIKPVPENYFVGELKCVEVDGTAIVGAGATTFSPLPQNDLKGEATIYNARVGSSPASFIDVRSYNAVGVQAVTGSPQPQPTDGTRVLCLGSNSASTNCKTAGFAACPSKLILNHLFDETFPSASFQRHTDLTLVPCSENFVNQDLQTLTTVQFLVYNEFEQRLSASTKVQCFKEIQLSHIDARPGNEVTSVFNIGVQGTLTGQTIIRPLTGTETDTGHGLLGVAEEFDSFASIGSQLELSRQGSVAWQVDYFPVTNPNKADVVSYVPGDSP